MELLIQALAQADAYPHPVDDVQRIETHTSWVFLAGPWVYKVKKPVNLGFLDYSTLQMRRHFCNEEVRLNRRYAPLVYIGVVPIDDTFCVEGPGEVVEWAVKMVRLPEDRTLLELLDRLTPPDLDRVGRHLAKLHRQAEQGPQMREQAHSRVVSHNMRENLTPTEAHVGWSVDPAVWSAVRRHSEEQLSKLAPLIDARASLARDTHGDLRAEHVYLMGEEILFIDCIEFNERFRFADPVADLAFLAMDLAVRGRRDLADALCDAWFEAMADGGRALLTFYMAYRSVVRAKVRGFQGDIVRARRHWLQALSLLVPAGEGP